MINIQPNPTAAISGSAKAITELLALGDIRVGGDRPWDLRVHNPGFFGRFLGQGTLGLGESYVDGWWDSDQLDETFNKAMSAHLETKIRLSWPLAIDLAKSRLFNRQSVSRSKTVARQHYDLGNDFYRDMLDPRMQYTCGYWNAGGRHAKTLDEAQENKLDLVCRKLGLQADETWHIGDSLSSDVAGAKAAGLTAVWLNRHGVQRTGSDPEPDYEIASLSELLPLLGLR
jgi:cyclopropane-fatty-acyl-phospholipid synthase